MKKIKIEYVNFNDIEKNFDEFEKRTKEWIENPIIVKKGKKNESVEK